jgi:hypothetical protein
MSQNQDLVAEKADDHSMKDEFDSIESKSPENKASSTMM